jgi:hypothetical protein
MHFGYVFCSFNSLVMSMYQRQVIWLNGHMHFGYVWQVINFVQFQVCSIIKFVHFSIILICYRLAPFWCSILAHYSTILHTPNFQTILICYTLGPFWCSILAHYSTILRTPNFSNNFSYIIT